MKKGACFLTIAARDPENLKGVDPERIARANIASGKANEEFSIEMMNSAVQWCIASIPVPSWAKKVFPDLSEEQAMENLRKRPDHRPSLCLRHRKGSELNGCRGMRN